MVSNQSVKDRQSLVQVRCWVVHSCTDALVYGISYMLDAFYHDILVLFSLIARWCLETCPHLPYKLIAAEYSSRACISLLSHQVMERPATNPVTLKSKVALWTCMYNLSLDLDFIVL